MTSNGIGVCALAQEWTSHRTNIRPSFQPLRVTLQHTHTHPHIHPYSRKSLSSHFCEISFSYRIVSAGCGLQMSTWHALSTNQAQISRSLSRNATILYFIFMYFFTFPLEQAFLSHKQSFLVTFLYFRFISCLTVSILRYLRHLTEHALPVENYFYVPSFNPLQLMLV